jgi:hypothetical protein
MLRRAPGEVQSPDFVRVAGEARCGAEWVVEGIGLFFIAHAAIIGQKVLQGNGWR